MSASRIEDLAELAGLPYGAADDRALTLAFQEGDEHAYREIYDRYHARVHGICRRMLGQHDDAQEAAQETFLKVYQALGKFNGRYQLGPWIARIATNVCLDLLRARTRHPSAATPLEVLDLEAVAGNGSEDPELFVLRNAESRRVRKVLEGLPPLHRAAIVLRDFEGLSYEDVAIVLGITECQVKALLHRARKSFRRSWGARRLAGLVSLPWLRRLQDGARDTAGQGASATHGADLAASVSNIVASCPGVLQQCGVFLSERAAAVVTTVVVGTAGLAGVAASLPTSDEPAPLVETHVKGAIVAPLMPDERRPGQGQDTADEQETTTDESAAQPAEAPEAPTDPESAPAPDEPAPDPQPTPTPTESPAPEPQGFSLGFSTDESFNGDPCPCMAPTAVQSESLEATDGGGIETFDQVATGTASAAGAPTYGLWWHHWTTPGSYHNAEFALKTGEGSYMYSASGALIDRARTQWGGWIYRYAGTYDFTSRPGYAESVPEHGTYTTEIVVSWRQNRVTSVSVALLETDE